MLESARRGDPPDHTIECVLVAAPIAFARGNRSVAARLVRAAVAEREKLGARYLPMVATQFDAFVREVEESVYAPMAADEQPLSLDEAVGLALRVLD